MKNTKRELFTGRLFAIRCAFQFDNTLRQSKEGDGVRDGDRVGGMGEHVKKAHKTDKTTGVPGRIETTVLTTANVARFFAPTYSAPRSKEQRKANPRPSVM